MKDNRRLESLDAFRGLDMMFLAGFSSIIVAVCCLFPGGADCWIVRQMEHAAWNGLTLMDMVFPTFLFVSGISWPFSYAKQLSSGSGKGRIYAKALRRALTLFAFGLLYNGLLSRLDFANARYLSVLGRIGFAWFFAAVIYMNSSRKAREAISVGLLVLYFVIMRFFTAPDAPAGADCFSLEGNIAGWIDRTLGIGSLYLGIFDPENLLGLIPSTVTALLGMQTGEYVRGEGQTGGRKTLVMLLTAAGMLCAGLLWSLFFPINKNLWTSSFTLVVGAVSLAGFALMYYVVDVRGHHRFAVPLKVVGMNSITIYMLQAFVDFGFTTRQIFGGLERVVGEPVGALIYSTGYFALSWLVLYFLYRKRVFLKV